MRTAYMNGLSSVVDMRWGVRDESTDDHATAAICLEEIRQCQATSVGPSFVYFAGQKYGYRPLPSVIGCEVIMDMDLFLLRLKYELCYFLVRNRSSRRSCGRCRISARTIPCFWSGTRRTPTRSLQS